MSSLYKAYNPLKQQLYVVILKITLIWFAAFILIIVLELMDLLPYFGFFVLSFVSLISAFLGKKVQVAMSGLRGESIVTDSAKELPKGYTAFANVILNFDGRDSETDLIIVGHKGVFIVEVKNHKGVITGRLNDRYWKQFKTTQNGGRYVNEFYNPTKQVKTHVFRLSEILKSKGFDGWIQGAVVFSNLESTVKVKGRDIPVKSNGEGPIDVLNEFQPKRELGKDEIRLITDAIKEQMLKQKVNSKNKKKSL